MDRRIGPSGEGARTRDRARAGGIAGTAWRGTLGAVAGLVLATAVEAQTFRFTTFDIQGNTRIEDATVLSTLGVTPGAPVSAAALNDGFQRLQASGLFQRVELIPQGGTLVIVVDEFPTISRIAIEGNRRLDDEDLLPIVGSRVRRVYDPEQARRDAAALTDAYTQSGRLAATVQPKIIERSDNRVDLVFEVSEGRTVEVERLSFTGNRAFSDRRLRRVLETSQAGFFRTLIGSDTFIADRVQLDQQLLRDFYLSRGYIDFQILSATPELSSSRDAYFLTFALREGQQFRFGETRVVSDLPEIDTDRYDRELRSRPGQIYSPQSVERSIERLELLATREGRQFVRVTPRVTRNDANLTLDIEFVVERGPRIFVERIDIEGNATTLDRVIRRQFDVVEGDPFNPREIRAAAERIRALDYFSQAEVNAREGSGPEQVIVDVDVEEQPTGSLGFGVNYSAEGGVGVAASFQETNFLGRGQTVNFSINTSAQSGSSSLSFVEPGFLDRDLALSFGLYRRVTDSDNATFDTESIGLNFGLTFPVGEFSRLGVFYEVKEDELTLNPGVTVSPILTREAGQPFVTSSLGYSYTYDTIGKSLDPNGGIRLSFGQEFAGLGGDTQFVKTSAAAVAQRAVLNEEVTLRFGLEGGAITQLDDEPSLAANRFFSNQRIIRGFESRGIGPRDTAPGAADDALGGNYYFAARAEAQFPLGFVPEEYGISGAVFADAGSVWGLDDTSGAGGVQVDDGFFLNSAVGVSLLWDTQIGPLRFNFSRALNKRSYDREQTFDLTIETRF